MKNNPLQECLNYIQTNLNAPKNRTNSFGNYKYRNLDDIFIGLKPLLEETGCVLTCDDSVESVGDRIYIKATATISKGDNEISCTAYARESEGRKGMDAAQNSGSCSSYSRKYALGGLFIIDDSQDIDSMDNTYTITDEQKTEYQKILQSGYFEGEKQNINKWWRGFNTEQQGNTALKSLRKRLEEKKQKDNNAIEKEKELQDA